MLSLRCVIAHVRFVRASWNRRVGLLSGFSTSFFFGDSATHNEWEMKEKDKVTRRDWEKEQKKNKVKGRESLC